MRRCALAVRVCSLAILSCAACFPSIDYGRLHADDAGEDTEVVDGADGDGGEAEVPRLCGNGVVDPGERCDTTAPAAPCATSCGSTGTSRCIACDAAPECNPPFEDCNGADDDCDTVTDEGYPCVANNSVACTTPCGVAGTGTCSATCDPPPRANCAAATEACNGCDDTGDGTTDEGCACARDWTIEHPLAPGPESLQFIVAGRDRLGEAFAVGPNGLVLHYDGSRWFKMVFPATYTLRSVDALSDDFAVAVGSSGSVFWWDGDRWRYDDTTRVAWTLYAVHIFAPNDVWAIGANGTAIHWDDTRWQLAPTGTPRHLYGLFAVAPDDLFAVGTSGAVMHYDGTGWTGISPAWITTDLETAWAPADGGHVYIGGTDGLIAVWDRASGIWTQQPTGTLETIYSIWGAAENDIWAVGGWTGGIVLHYDGSGWAQDRSVPSLDRRGFLSMSGTAADNVFAAMRDGGILHYDGTSWMPMEGAVTVSLRSVWGTSPHDVFAVGSATDPAGRTYSAVLRYDGTRWLFASGDWLPGVDGQDVWASSPSDILVVGGDATVRRFDGTSWGLSSVSFPRVQLFGVWGAAADQVFVVGGQDFAGGLPTAFQRVLSPPSWSPFLLSPDLPDVDLLEVSGTTADDLIAVGTGGTIFRRTGTDTMQQDSSGTTETLRGIWAASATEAFAVGDNGVILHWDGTNWTSMTTAADPWVGFRLYGVWGSSPTNVFAAGEAATLLRWDGSSWTAIPLGALTVLNTLTGVWGSSANNVFVVADDRSGLILHRCGLAW